MEIKFTNINFSYGGEDFINIPKLVLESGKVYNLVGSNGSGKSTLALLLSGVTEVENMEVFIDGDKADFKMLSPTVVFQNPDFQFVKSTVIDEIAFGLENQALQREEILRIIHEYAELFGVEDLLSVKVPDLSGGQKQKIAIISSLVLKPKLLILDEVFEMLDIESKEAIIEILRKYLKENDLSIININHDENIIKRFSQTILIDEGKIKLKTNTDDLFKDVDQLRKYNLKRPFEYDVMESLNITKKEYQELFWN